MFGRMKMKRRIGTFLLIVAPVVQQGCATSIRSLRDDHVTMHIPVHSGACVLKHFYLEDPDTERLYVVNTDPEDADVVSFVRADAPNLAVILKDRHGEFSVPVFSNDFPNLQMELDQQWKYGDKTNTPVRSSVSDGK